MKRLLAVSSCGRIFPLLATFVFLVFEPSRAQDSQFYFDPGGYLAAQAAEHPVLPQIVGQPQYQVVIPGETASFSVVLADARGISYQWLFDSSAISGATSDSLLLANVSATNEGSYSVVLVNGSGSVTSSVAQLYIDSRGVGMPDSWQISYFGNLTQNPLGDFDGDGISNLQEFLDGTNPTNALSALYRISLVNDGGTVIMTPSQTAYTNGQVITLTATGSGALPFHAWTGDIVSRTNPLTVTMTNNLNLFAHFQPFLIHWTNSAGGDWNVAANWLPNLVPSTNEDVDIGQSAALLNGVVVTENSNVDLHDLTLSRPYAGSELTGSGRVTIAHAGVWCDGTLSGSGSLVVLPGATLTISNLGPTSINNRTLENAGATSWIGGNMQMGNGIITNDPGAQFQLLNSASFTYAGGTPRFDNAGTLLLPPGGATAFNQVTFNNYQNTLNLTGTGASLLMSAGGVETGTITVPAGTTINFAAGLFNCSANSSITGAGVLIVSGGTANFAGTVNVTATNSFSNGTANFTGNYTCVSNTLLDISGGTVNFDGTGIVAPNNLNLNGILDGAQTVTVLNSMNWTGGTMQGSGRTFIGPQATLNIAAFTGYGGVFMYDRTLENAGTMVWGGGNFGTTGVVTNDAGASFQILNAEAFNFEGGSPRFDNAGSFLPSPTGSTAFNGVLVDNYGSINLNGGSTLYLGGGLNTGPITIPAGAVLDFSGGTFNAGADSSITGAGTLLVSGGTANLGGTVNVTGTNSFSNGTANLTGNYTCVSNTLLDISGGTANFDGTGIIAPNNLNLNGLTAILGGGQTVTVGNSMNWVVGNMSGSGRTVIGPHATLNLATFTGYAGVFVYSRTLENAGAVFWGGGNFGLSGLITNDPGAIFQISGGSTFTYQGGSARFDNAGTFNLTGVGGTLLGVPLNNFGAIGIQRTILNASGGYSCSPNSALNFPLGGNVAGASYGQLRVPYAVNLQGSLNVSLTNYYVPRTNDSFTLVTAGSFTGAFSSFIYPSNSVSLTLSNAPAAEIVQVTGVSLKQTNALPAPSGLISWWRGENNANDSVGPNNGAITNGVTYAPGEEGQSFLLDGTNGCVYVPDSPSLRPASITAEAWVKIFSTNGIQLVFAKPLGTNTLDSFGLAIQNGASLGAICDTNGFGTFLNDTNQLTLGQWHHLAFTFDATSGFQALYTDGAAVASGSAGKSMQYDNHPLLLGADIENAVPSYFLNGQIDEASLYNRALTADEIQSIYNAGALGIQFIPPSQPVLHLEMITSTAARIYWSTNYPLFQLQYNTQLGSTNWAASGLAPVVTGTNLVVTNLLVGTQKYYRLSQQPAAYIPPPPALAIQFVAPSSVKLTWSALDDRPFVLQSSTNLAGANWATITSPPTQTGSNYILTNSVLGRQTFYRLSSP